MQNISPIRIDGRKRAASALPNHRVRANALRFVLGILALSLIPALCLDQVAPIGEKSMGDSAHDKLPDVLQRATIHQQLGQQLPLDASFRDSTGKTVTLGSYFGQRPAILALVYYRCPMLCSEELNSLVGALEMLDMTPGKDYDVIVASIDPSEGPALAAAEKKLDLKRFGRPATAKGWQYLSGDESSITALASAVGFGYVRVPGPDGKLDQFAHTSAVEVITSEGKISQYYLGVEYPPKEMQIAIREASHDKVGTLAQLILTYCYRYDPRTGHRSLIVVRIVQLGCLLTVLALGGYMLAMFRLDAINNSKIRTLNKANG